VTASVRDAIHTLVAAFDLDALIARALSQRKRLEGERMRAADAAFSG
jgi:hypothetical protein